MSVVMEPETDLHQLTQEIVRISGIIRVNYPELHASICRNPWCVSYQENHLEEEELPSYLEFLNDQLLAHRSSVRTN